MKLYCMCRTRKGMIDGQEFLAPNRFAPGRIEQLDIDDDFRTFVLQKPMKLTKVGAKQMLLFPNVKKPNDWKEPIMPKDILKQHYPNVDVFQCRHCGAMIVRE